MLRNILTSAPRTEPLIRIYPTYISFNHPAAKLLGLKECKAVAIQQDDRDGYVYVAGCNDMKQTYGLRLRNNTFVLRQWSGQPNAEAHHISLFCSRRILFSDGFRR